MPTRSEIGTTLNLSEVMIKPGRRNRPGTGMRPTSITVHNTDNADVGAGADAHASFVTKKGYYLWKGSKVWVSQHYTVDDIKSTKHLPIHEVSYHAGKAANTSSISIEICMNKDIDQNTADDRAARLVAVLLYDLGLDKNVVRTHKSWTKKTCPQLLLGNSAGMDWSTFIETVEKYRLSITDAQFVPSEDLIAKDIAEILSDDELKSQKIDSEVLEFLDTDIDHAAIRDSMNEK